MIREGKNSEFDNALLSAKLRETTGEPLIEYAGPRYRSLFDATTPFYS